MPVCKPSAQDHVPHPKRVCQLPDPAGRWDIYYLRLSFNVRVGYDGDPAFTVSGAEK